MATVTVLPTRGKTSNDLRKCNSRKAVASVDTNLGSYDRTDPFPAFNALLKLISSLSSRVGGCKYKMSPQEHKLSLHLLTIIEPFVGLAPSRRTITCQPTEILDSIAFHIDSKRDLLSFAVSCRRMYGIVFPRHFNYRTIRCKVSSISVWNHLIVHRSLARNVRRLEILDERSTEASSVPSGLSASDTDLESSDDELELHAKQERYLVSALTRMSALQSFSWSCNHSPISIDHVWPTLLKCHTLKEIVINDNLMFNSCPPIMGDVDASAHIGNLLIDLPELKTVIIRSTKHTYGSARYPVLSRISGMLSQCPNLKSLNIAHFPPRSMQGCTPPPVDGFFLCNRWHLLTSLTLTNLRCPRNVGSDALAAFLSAHVNLEVLNLDISRAMGGESRLALPHNSLPCLRELRSNHEIINAVLECRCDFPRPLATIKGVRLYGSLLGDSACGQDHTFLANLKRHGKALKRIEMTGWNEMDDIRKLVDCVPGLTWLDVGERNSSLHASLVKDKFIPVFNTVEWAILLSALPELVTFHGVRFFHTIFDTSYVHKTNEISASDRSRIRKNDEIASVLAWKCPKLRRVDHWDDAGRVIILVRDSSTGSSGNKIGVANREKVRWEVRRVKV